MRPIFNQNQVWLPLNPVHGPLFSTIKGYSYIIFLIEMGGSYYALINK